MRLALCSFVAALAASSSAWAAPPEGAAASAASSSEGGVAPSVASSAEGSGAPSAAAAPFAGAAGAEAEAPVATGGKPAPGFGLDLRVGMRVGWLTSPGFDPFHENDALTQVSLGASYALTRSGPLSVHAGALYDFGASRAEARGAGSRLGVHRVALGLEGRYELSSWLRPYARVAPGALRLNARVDDPAGGEALENGQWTWSLDAAAGAALFLAPLGRKDAPVANLLVFAEGGYGFAGSVSMAMRPEGGGEGARAGEVSLPPLRPSGALLRLGAGFAF